MSGRVPAAMVVDLSVKSSLLSVGPTAAGLFNGPLRIAPGRAKIKALSSPPTPVPVLLPALSTPSVLGLATPFNEAPTPFGPGPAEPSALKLLDWLSPDSS